MTIGEGKRVLFQTNIIEDTDLNVAHVVAVEQDYIIIDQGEPAGVRFGDRYHIKSPCEKNSTPVSVDEQVVAQDVIQVQITSVGAMSAHARLCSSKVPKAQTVCPGWFAYLLSVSKVSMLALRLMKAILIMPWSLRFVVTGFNTTIYLTSTSHLPSKITICSPSMGDGISRCPGRQSFRCPR